MGIKPSLTLLSYCFYLKSPLLFFPQYILIGIGPANAVQQWFFQQAISDLQMLQNSCQISILTSSGLKRPYSVNLSSYVFLLNLLSLLISHEQSKVSLFRYISQNWIASADNQQNVSSFAHEKFPYQCASELGVAFFYILIFLMGIDFMIGYIT